ncbi:hypothetical protein IFM12275_23520 [Nocardia sputorum]|uniref:hypothetical protein n=1 Tax=Nocardia sputorum TaxID=2984338 RepID=UPI002492CE6A|nr:hypothetical protein [Nocardia sputorum]BDT92376.1 hypothetical protein IFM12275_23520 [Nocardia sputorum]
MVGQLSRRLVLDELWELAEPLLQTFRPREQDGVSTPTCQRARKTGARSHTGPATAALGGPTRRATVPIFVVSRDAGHESVNTTDRYYGHNDRKASESAT